MPQLLFSQASNADTPAIRRLMEFLGAIPDASPEHVIQFVQTHYAPGCADELPFGSRIASFMDWKARGGMELQEILASQPHCVEARILQPLTGELRILNMQVQEHPPHRIQSLKLGRAPLPPELGLDDQAAADRFISYMDSLAAARLFSGTALIARHGKVLARKAWGLANHDFQIPNNLQTRFNVGSVNKNWTGVAVAQLVEAGRMSFSDSLAQYLPFPSKEAAAKIQVAHLLSHTSGLQSYFTDAFARCSRGLLRTVDDFMELSKDQPLAFEPGTGWKYSNTGMLVAGKVVELVSGQSYFDYIQTNVLARAGMGRSGCFELDRVNGNLAVGYHQRWSASGVETLNNIFEHVVRGGPAGGCYATVEDLFHFSEALKSGRLVSPPMAELITSAKPELGSPLYGFGFAIHPERALYGHDGRFTGISANLDITESPPGWVIAVLANANSMRAPVLKARQLIGVRIPETTAEKGSLASARPRPR